MIPVVSFVGYSNSGKTTFLVKVIRELKVRGYRVGVIKHDGHDFEIDHPGTDSWQHRQAGADCVCIASASKAAIIKTLSPATTLDDLLHLFDNVDLIVTEGFKQEQKPQIEVHRPGVEPLGCKENTLAVVSDSILYADVPHFGTNDVQGVVTLLLRKFITGD